MTQPALLYIAGATEGTTQWRAELLQVVNWGGFHGHAQMAIAHDTTLLSGASGTGKSTILDAYLALMMPFDTPFNGASNDATSGRARGAGQRNLLTYLRGKLDDNRESGSDVLTDRVLRGADSPTWGAIAMTFVNDHGGRFTALRAYFVPRGAARSSDITMRLATTDGRLNLRDLEPAARAHFDKRTLTSRWPDMTVHEKYGAFAQTLFTRLGIGAGGDGEKALRLLARIQGGQQIRTVDGLYKTMVLEEPATYAAADRAATHFSDLDASYQAMLTEADKLHVLRELPQLHRDLDDARQIEHMIDTFGIQRDGDSPFLIWQLGTEQRLLRADVDNNRERRREVARIFSEAKTAESDVTAQVQEVEEQRRTNGGDALERLTRTIEDLNDQRAKADNRRALFDDRTTVLQVAPKNRIEFDAVQADAVTFMTEFTKHGDDLDKQIRQVGEDGYPLTVKRKDLLDDQKSLQGREGLVPRRLHSARLVIAEACGMNPADLPFVAELLDVAAGEEQWRRAAEVALFSLARIMLVDIDRLDYLSRTIDRVKVPYRIRFEGVPPRPFATIPADPRYLSGKVIHKDSPFSSWIQERLRRRGTDALCVSDATDLRGEGMRITVNGQTRDGSSGAHGELSDPPIIGFSNVDRLRDIERELGDLDRELGNLGRRDAELKAEVQQLRKCRDAYQLVIDTDWSHIDVDGIAGEIRQREQERDRILETSDVLAALQITHSKLTSRLEKIRRDKFGAEQDRERLDREHGALAIRQDEVDLDLDRIERDRTATTTSDQAEYLDKIFADVGNPNSLGDLKNGIRRLHTKLAETSTGARRDVTKATESMCRIFDSYQGRWPDPNLGTTIDSYDGYRDILDTIIATGLHERRQEWRRRLSEWSGQDLVPLNGAFDTAIEDIEDRLAPVNAILADLPFGPHRDRLRIALRRLTSHDVTRFRRELKDLSSGLTQDASDDQIEHRFNRLRAFIALVRTPDATTKSTGVSRDTYLDVRKHVEITAVRTNAAGIDVATYASLGGKSGGETQELVAFIVGAALRFQLGDEDRVRPRFAPVFLDEGFIKSDAEFAGRAVHAWKGLGFQLVIGAPLDKVTALEPDMELLLTITKSAAGYSHIAELRPTGPRT